MKSQPFVAILRLTIQYVLIANHHLITSCVLKENIKIGPRATTLSQSCLVISRSVSRLLNRPESQTLDCDLTEKKLAEQVVVPYSDKLFHQSEIEWLVATDQASTTDVLLAVLY